MPPGAEGRLAIALGCKIAEPVEVADVDSSQAPHTRVASVDAC